MANLFNDIAKYGRKKYGGNAEFQDYFKKSWCLIPYVY